MSEKKDVGKLSCSDCGVLNCYRQDKVFPDFCLTANADSEEVAEVTRLYQGDGLTAKISRAAAEIEGTYYGKLTRVEEIVAFAKRIGAQKIGIATCIGLINETRIFAKVLAAKGLTGYSVLCKAGSIDKTQIGIPEELKVQKGCYEAICNPVLQAKLLNKEKTDLNVINGLCVGHDSLFIKYSEAPVTTLITKDRVTGHNPAAALYTSGFYYKRLLQEEKD
ncbi:MAG TPA: DUF1847 domain-containing protein [Methylomusa anaerophila]|uniref:DUF1847 domain-containing protein n=1 Tax=Methylomusa anaerophila TaxID=1930071 RepID=A0A348AQT6_9FIRM|nr:DUF1847 domain-containing protein [Methylomusa anaerophila]BBB93434.1 hypothetical protein MAMMFC1_04151 [Methylomusa anaerophila]HML90058.1 DUF1847 domain-containing protein [Methylomusa anaerophila]